MSAEAELIFTALLNDLRFHPFIIELLDLGGYDTLIKLKMLNQAIVEKLPDLITAENITKFQHIEAYNYELVEKIKTDSSVKFFLKVGDHFLLQEMERHLLPIEPKLNRKIKRLPKVKAPLKRQRDELLCEIEVQNEEPPSKRVKLTNEQMLIVFSNFVTKNINGSGVDVILDGSGAAPKFKLRCSTCSKEICIGYKITSAGSPSFIKTNLMKHVCFKENLIVKEKNASQIDVCNDDSGLG